MDIEKKKRRLDPVDILYAALSGTLAVAAGVFALPAAGIEHIREKRREKRLAALEERKITLL